MRIELVPGLLLTKAKQLDSKEFFIEEYVYEITNVSSESKYKIGQKLIVKKTSGKLFFDSEEEQTLIDEQDIIGVFYDKESDIKG